MTPSRHAGSTDAERAMRLARVDRLEGYLRDDPTNGPLRLDAFDAALAAGAFDRGALHVREARRLGHDPAAWTWREARLAMAELRFDDARRCLAGLIDDAAFAHGPASAALAHDLALADLRSGDADAAVARLAPWLEPVASVGQVNTPDDLRPALETLWLRVLHHAGALARGMAWIADRQTRAPALDARSAGVASLLALDAGDTAASLAWADRSLAGSGDGAAPAEALVARASLALAEGDAERARTLAMRAVDANPADGRSWSALAFAELLDGRPGTARHPFERAVAAMPSHIGTWHGLGWTGIAVRDPALARRAFEAALALDRTFADSWGGLAVVHVLAGDREAARASIDRALGLDRASLSARYAEALFAGEASDAEALQRLAERLLRGRAAPLGGKVLDLLKRR